MCGIAGFCGDFDADVLVRMNRVQSHRGPDDAGTWHSAAHSVGLAQRRLSIIDLSPLGHQPMWDATRTVVGVFNGEIYNYRELRDELRRDGFRFVGESDTEVLLSLYLRDGVDALPKLNGIFACVLWDTRSRSLLVARDGMGVKPLYYAETTKGLILASEIKALLQERSVERTIDPVAIQHYLTYLWCPAPRTALQAVKKLEPGHALRVHDGRIEKRWQFYELPCGLPLDTAAPDDAAALVRQTLRQAVKRQMVADVPVGAFLSGGLDSSAVAAFAQEAMPGGRLQCFTIGFKREAESSLDGMPVDLPFARQAAEHLGVDLHVIDVGVDMLDHLERMIYHLDEPQADPAPINVLLISRLAREHGITVLLSGTGGDDLFTGYRRHFALLQERYWAWLPLALRRRLAAAASRVSPVSPFVRRAAKALQYADLPGDARIASYFFWTHRDLLRSLAGPVLRDAFAAHDQAAPLLESLSRMPADTPALNKMLYLEGKHFLCDHNLNYTDKMGMAAGVEVRVPFLDPDLVAVAARLPIGYKQHGRTGKWILKKAMEQHLPPAIIHRAKTGFGAPLRSWLKHEPGSAVEDALSDAAVRQRGLFDPAGVRRLVEDNRAGRIDASYTVFALVCVELWCRLFVDQPQRASA